MKKIIICLLFFLVINHNLSAQNKKAIDSLTRVYNNAKHDTSRIMVLTSIAFEYRDAKPDTCISIAQKALEMSEKINFKKGKGQAWSGIGGGNLVKGNYPLALEYYQKTLKIREEIGDKQGVNGSSNNIGLIYRNQGNYPLALEYFQKSLKIREEIGDKQVISSSLDLIGGIYKNQGNYPLALEYYQKSLKIREEMGNKQIIGYSLNNIGTIYDYQSNYPLALEYYQKSLKIQEELGDKQGISHSLHNIAGIYSNQDNDSLALKYYQKSLKVLEELGNKQDISISLNNIGSIYQDKGNYPLALEYYQKSLKIVEEIGDKQGLTYPLNSIASIYEKEKDYEKSIEYAQKSLQIAQEIEAPLEIKDASKTLYNTYKRKGDYTKALEYHELYKQMNDTLFNIDKSKAIANLEAKAEIERKEKEIEILNKTKELDQKAKESLQKDLKLQQIEAERQKNAKIALEKEAEADRLLALARQEKDKRKQDSLQNLAQKTQLEADNLKIKEQKLKAESNARKLELLKEKDAKEFQQYITYLVVAGLLSVLVFAFFIFQSRQKERKAKMLIAEQKEEVLQQKEEIQQINEELTITLETVKEQKNEIEHKSQAIEDSINYAQRIQKTILPLDEHIKEYLNDYFIFFQPRDVVSGDFYYFEEKNGKLFLAAIDCTGHGVPGAFMTMIASEILNEIIINKGISQPDEILNELHKRIRIALKQAENQNRDGMDLVLLVIEPQKKVVHFAGAKNALIYIQNNELYQIKGDKMPIGGEQKEQERIFSPHTIDVSVPTSFYLFSDGLQDQFGGVDRKKFMIAQLKKILLEIHPQDMEVQKKIIANTINEWIKIGNEKQIDDMLLWGIKM